jgi:hypothetical protein
MNRNRKTNKLTLRTDTLRRLSSVELGEVVGGADTQTICPTFMQTHCASCRIFHTCRCE